MLVLFCRSMRDSTPIRDTSGRRAGDGRGWSAKDGGVCSCGPSTQHRYPHRGGERPQCRRGRQRAGDRDPPVQVARPHRLPDIAGLRSRRNAGRQGDDRRGSDRGKGIDAGARPTPGSHRKTIWRRRLFRHRRPVPLTGPATLALCIRRCRCGTFRNRHWHSYLCDERHQDAACRHVDDRCGLAVDGAMQTERLDPPFKRKQ